MFAALLWTATRVTPGCIPVHAARTGPHQGVVFKASVTALGLRAITVR
jgi:hypothetical protein